MKILIGGGTGFIGRRLSNVLVKKGHEVVFVSRNNSPGHLTWLDIESHGLPRDTGAVVNLAGCLLMDPSKRWNEDFKRQLRESRIMTTSLLRDAIKASSNPPKVFVGSSAVGYYPVSESREYTEDDVIPPTNFMSELCRDWEAVAQLPASCNTRQVTVRIGIVLGREGGVIKNMIIPFWLGFGGPISDGKQFFPWVHVEDVAGIMAHAIDNDNVTGILNATAPMPVTNAQFTQAFAKALWRLAYIPVPTFLLNAVFGSERALVMTQGQKVLPKRTLESGYKFKYPDITSACKECAHLAPKIETVSLN